VGDAIIGAYAANLSAMFRDLRAELNAPDMPIVIGEMGVGGEEMVLRAEDPGDREARAMAAFRNAQKAAADGARISNVSFVPTTHLWDVRLQELRAIADEYWGEKQRQGIPHTAEHDLPTKELNDEYKRLGGHWYCHYNGSAANYSLMGHALAQALAR
jgi:hypothetical protein